MYGENKCTIQNYFQSKNPFRGLRVISISKLGLRVDDSKLKVSFALRVGASLYVTYSYAVYRLPRHVNINDVLKRGLTSAGIPQGWTHTTTLLRSHSKTVQVSYMGRNLYGTFSNSSRINADAAAEEQKRYGCSSLTDRNIFEPVAIETTQGDEYIYTD